MPSNCTAYPDKDRLATGTEALEAVKRVFEKYGKHQYAYFCVACSGHHLSSQPPDAHGLARGFLQTSIPIIKTRKGTLTPLQQETLIELNNEGLSTTEISERMASWELTPKQVASKLRHLDQNLNKKSSFPDEIQGKIINLHKESRYSYDEIGKACGVGYTKVKGTLNYFHKLEKKNKTLPVHAEIVVPQSNDIKAFKAVRDDVNGGFIIQKEDVTLWLTAIEVLKLFGTAIQVQ